MTKWIETYHVVPAVEEWLIERGYTWDREVIFTNGLRADFIATYPQTGEVMIIEVKGDKYNPDKVVKQVTDYGVIYGNPNAKLAIAIPATALRESLELICEKRGIQLILLDCVAFEFETELATPIVEQRIIPVEPDVSAIRALILTGDELEAFSTLDPDIQLVVIDCILKHSTAPIEALAASRGIDLHLDKETYKSWNS